MRSAWTLETLHTLCSRALLLAVLPLLFPLRLWHCLIVLCSSVSRKFVQLALWFGWSFGRHCSLAGTSGLGLVHHAAQLPPAMMNRIVVSNRSSAKFQQVVLLSTSSTLRGSRPSRAQRVPLQFDCAREVGRGGGSDHGPSRREVPLASSVCLSPSSVILALPGSVTIAR